MSNSFIVLFYKSTECNMQLQNSSTWKRLLMVFSANINCATSQRILYHTMVIRIYTLQNKLYMFYTAEKIYATITYVY